MDFMMIINCKINISCGRMPLYFLILSFSLLLANRSSSQETGDIPFNKNTDDSTFYLCNPQWIPQYYQVGTNYQGGMNAIRKIFNSKYEHVEVKNVKQQTGYITIRFIVNCKGATNRFRMYEVDSLYKPYRFDALITKRLLDITTSLNGWTPGTFQNVKTDSYYYLNFKIVRGELKEITP